MRETVAAVAGPMTSTTRIVIADQPGGPEVLHVAEEELPAPGPGQVAVAVRAAGVNPIDHKLLSGARGAPFPFRPGNEVAGIVTAVGTGVERFAVGDEVIGYRVSGGFAADLVTSQDDLVGKPAALSWELAAGLLLAATTAEHVLAATAVGPGDTVLVHGASGSVGQLAVQLALGRGATVIGTASPRNHELVHGLGATPVAYGEGLRGRVEALAPDGVDVAIDLVGSPEALDVSLALVADPARVVTAVAPPGFLAAGAKAVGGAPGADPGDGLRYAARERLAALAADGALVLPVVRTYPLEQAGDALAFVLDGHAAGKVVLIP